MTKIIGFCRYEKVGEPEKIYTYTLLVDGQREVRSVASTEEYSGTLEEVEALLQLGVLSQVVEV